MPICPVTKKNNFILPVRKKLPHLLPPFCTPLAQGAKILTRQIRFRPTYACKLLSRSVKVCRSYSRKADFQQIHTGITLPVSCICMTAYNNHFYGIIICPIAIAYSMAQTTNSVCLCLCVLSWSHFYRLCQNFNPQK